MYFLVLNLNPTYTILIVKVKFLPTPGILDIIFFRTFILLVLLADIGNPYSLDVFEGHVYWTTKVRGEVWKADKFGKGDKVKVLTINPWLTQVRIYHEHRYNRSGEKQLLTCYYSKYVHL